MKQAIAMVLLVAIAAPVHAWEPETTHAGLTERAAERSQLHERLREQLGYERGLYAALIVPPPDAPELFAILARLNPTHGYVPDARGRQLALGWLTAGSVLAEVPARLAANHFFDPTSGTGLTAATIRGFRSRLRNALLGRLAGDDVPTSGIPAPQWLDHPDNPMGLRSFWTQYANAVSAASPAERDRALASALLAAGAMLHVLQDMGSPSHARNDLAAHLERLGSTTDRGSRLERIAALAFGRLGVPAAAKPVTAASAPAFLTSADGTGLADLTARSWFSPYTLPTAVEAERRTPSNVLATRLARATRRPAPIPPGRLDLMRALRAAHGARLENDHGTCVAAYRLEDEQLTWLLDDSCVLEQVAEILPQVGAYGAGFLDYLFRAAPTIVLDGAPRVVAGGTDFGPGTVQLFSEDTAGARTAVGAPLAVTGARAGAVLTHLPALPAGARRFAILYRGVDASGQPLLGSATANVP